MTRILIQTGIIDWEQREALIASGLLTERDFRERKKGYVEYYCKKDELSSCKVTIGMLLSLSEVFSLTVDKRFITIRDF